MFVRTKGQRAAYAPKGSFHHFCRRKIEENSRLAQTKVLSLTRPSMQSAYTHRERQVQPQNIKDCSLTFEEYLQQFQQPKKNQTCRENYTAAHPKRQKRNRSQNQRQQEKSLGVIESRLPFFKCKIDRGEPNCHKTDFRVKELKFRLNRNVVEQNLWGISQGM